MTTTRTTRRTRTGKLAATTAAMLSLLGLATLAGPAGANSDTTPPTANPMATSPANENGWYREGPGIQWNWADDAIGRARKYWYPFVSAGNLDG